MAVTAAGWVVLVTRRLRRFQISTTSETPPLRVLRSTDPFWLYELSKFWSTAYVRDRTEGGDGTHLENDEEHSIRWTGWIFAKSPILPELNLVGRVIKPGAAS